MTASPKMPELNACPCGGKAEIGNINASEAGYWVGCENRTCRLYLYPGRSYYRNDAIRVWNLLTPPHAPPTPAMVLDDIQYIEIRLSHLTDRVYHGKLGDAARRIANFILTRHRGAGKGEL